MQTKTQMLIAYKTLFALLGFSAIVTEIATLVERNSFSPVNFFSFFTIETNILVCVVLLLSAFLSVLGKNQTIAALRGATTVYILVVGIGFALLLSGLENVTFTAVPWDNIVLHYILPIVVLVDYMIDRPGKILRFKKSLVWLAFPVAYLAYSLIRGYVTGWYPYPFLNPMTSGVESVWIAVIGMLALGVGLIAGITWVSKRPVR